MWMMTWRALSVYSVTRPQGGFCECMSNLVFGGYELTVRPYAE